MNKSAFLKHPEVEAFTDWFAKVLREQEPLNFTHANGKVKFFQSALHAYAWPPKRVDIPTPMGMRSIAARGTFRENNKVLEELAQGLQCSLRLGKAGNKDLAAWVKAVLIWGGVFTARGNGQWLEDMRSNLSDYLNTTLEHLSRNETSALASIPNLRSNAGTTKIHSLLLPNFVIYDSRVAASLAWLVWTWAKHTHTKTPEVLRFACMKANTTKTKVRSPCTACFPYFSASGNISKHRKHAYWNLLANWVIESSITKARQHSCAGELDARSVEATLFTLGNDLQFAI